MRTRFHRNAVEFQLTRVWESILGLDEVMPWDDFFDLGGDSITALQVVAETSRRTGIKFGLRDLLEGRTVENLVADLSKEVPLRAGSVIELNKVESRTVVVFPHSASGEVFYLRDLGDRVGVNMLGLRASGLEDATQIDKTVQEMASRYASSAAPFLHGRDVVLVGYSLGAFIAIKLVDELSARGIAISGLLLIEPPPATDGKREPGTFEDYVEQRYSYLRKNYDLAEASRDHIRLESVRRAGAIAPVTSDEDFMRAQEVWAHNMVAGDTYEPPAVLEVPTIFYFSSVEEVAGTREQWLSRSSRTVHVREFDSDHFSILRDVHMLDSIRIDVNGLSSAQEHAESPTTS